MGEHNISYSFKHSSKINTRYLSPFILRHTKCSLSIDPSGGMDTPSLISTLRGIAAKLLKGLLGITFFRDSPISIINDMERLLEASPTTSVSG